MKTVPAALTDAIRTSHNLYARPRLMVEWNLNRYIDVSADNVPNESDFGYDPEYFPIESIYGANRPTKGIVKARVDEASISNDDPQKQNVRYYVSSVDDLYKYWCSPVETNGSKVFPNHTDGITMVRPYIEYTTPAQANKIVIKTENSWAEMNDFDVRVKATTGGPWDIVATQPAINSATGEVTLYYNGTSWGTTKPSGIIPTTAVAGIRLHVRSMKEGRNANGNPSMYRLNGTMYNTTGANSFFNLIEIAACREVDLTDRLVSVSDTFDMSEKSTIYPIGTVTANTANIVLSNVDGIFNNDNLSSPYAGLLEPNALFNLEYVYTVGGTDYPVQEFKMYGGPWSGVKADETLVELRDYSKFFDEEQPNPVFWMNRTVSEIIWRLCDQVGFNNYAVGLDTVTAQPIIPYFWTDGSQTMWQILGELSKATQTAVYFDAWGVLQIRSRNHAFNTSKIPDWTLRGETSGTNLADIVSLDQSDELETNYVKVVYQTTDITDWNKGIPKLSRVWEPEGTTVLRASPLQRTMSAVDDWAWVSAADAILWPYEGILQIEGELIRYSGKQFRYYEGGVRKHAIVTSHEEYEKFNNITPPNSRYMNHFSGALKVSERGLWNSEAKYHGVEANGYSTRTVISGTRNVNASGFAHIKAESKVRLNAGAAKDANSLLVATRGNSVDSGYYYYGTKLRFTNSPAKADQKAGLVIHNNGTNEDGYYIEVQQTAKLDRSVRNELVIFNRKGGVNRRLGGSGVAVAMPPNIWHTIDVRLSIVGTTHYISVSINGVEKMNVSVSGTDRNTWGGKFGMHLRGRSQAEFEYLYAVAQPQGEPTDDTSFWDRVDGGYQGRQWESEWVFRVRTHTRRRKRITGKEKSRWNKMLMDEFGPIAHEVREFDVKFDPSPVLHSKLMLSSTDAICTEYLGTSFGAKFIVANVARRNVVIHGGDVSFQASADETNQIFTVLGRNVEISEAEEIVVENEQQVRARGRIETEVNSPWIQSKNTADKLGKWITNHWSKGSDEQSVVLFGNPLFEIGDVVSVEYPDMHMAALSHKYFVTSVSTDFSSGLETTLILRRVV